MSDIRLIASTTPTRRTADGQYLDVRGARDGSMVIMDWKQALALEGRLYLVQLGTEDAPIASTTSIDDQLVWAVVDVPSGTTVLPVFAQVAIGTWTTSALLNFMIEIDNAQTRYASGGTAFTPLALGRTDAPDSSNCTVYVGTDVTVGAKTSGGSLEVHRVSIEDNWGDTGDSFIIPDYRPDPMPAVVGPASVLFHLGAGTADVTAYGSMQWFEVPSSSVV